MGTSPRWPVLWAAVLCGLVLLRPVPVAALTLDFPSIYSVKRSWSAEKLGIDGSLGGMMFSGDGNTLYVVGWSENQPNDVLWAVPVTRTGREVTDLATATKVFEGEHPSFGIGAGLELGPSGTLFFTYWGGANTAIGQRPGGPGGATETSYDLAGFGTGAGLTFSPLRTDAGTAFGMLQVSQYNENGNGFGLIKDIPLTAAGGGL
ncbi:MAG: hypothetical protein FJ148_12760 [Deltaproteobacteria bacterium]|nr:hypothetical protein [Deltaproteobacteria bacterium]